MPKKITLEFVKKQFELNGYQLISSEYLNNQQKLEYICPKGHRTSTTWQSWQQVKNGRCRYCAREITGQKLRKNFKEIKESFRNEKYELLTTEYKNAHQKLSYICPKGRKGNIAWNTWQQGHRCPCCAGYDRSNIEFIKVKFVEEGYKLLSTQYTGSRQKLEYICPQNHKHSISWTNWKLGRRCPYCSNRIKKTLKFIKSEFEREGYIFLSILYKGAYQKLKFICPDGHKHSISWTNWQQGQRCGICNRHVLPKIKSIKEKFKNEGYTLLSKRCTSSSQKLSCICPEGHKYKVKWNSWQQGQRCPKCNNEKLSKLRKYLWTTTEYRERITEKTRQLWTNSQHRKRMGMLSKQRWQDPIFQKKIRKSINRKPNKPEKFLTNLLQKLFLNEYKYVGDFQFFIGGKNPDFLNVNSQKKKLIEIFGDHWHSPKITGLSREQHKQDRIDHFKQFGFSTLIIWENELKNKRL